MGLMTFIIAVVPLIADSSDSDAAAAAPLILLLSGFVFYWYIYSRYRNADKRHSHESETSAAIENLVSTDTFIQSRKGLSNAELRGANHTRIDGALNHNSKASEMLGKYLPK